MNIHFRNLYSALFALVVTLGAAVSGHSIPIDHPVPDADMAASPALLATQPQSTFFLMLLPPC